MSLRRPSLRWGQHVLVGVLVTTQALPLSAWAQAAPVQDTITQYEYDAEGNRTKITDPRGQVRVQSYDALQRLIQQRLPLPKAGAAQPQIDYGYDKRDQLTSVTDPRRNTSSYGVDGLGNPVNLISPDTGTTLSKVDAAGNVTEVTNARGQKIVYAYDTLNRLTQATYPGGAKTVYGYDAYSTAAGSENYGRGRLTSITEFNASAQQTSRLAFAYDAQGRLTRRCQIWGTATNCTPAHTLSYRWGSGAQTGRLLGLTYPSGRKVDYQYDSQGRISAITTTHPGAGTAQAVISKVQYQPLGVGDYAVKSFTFGNGSAAPVQSYSRSYDLDGRITGFTLGKGAPGVSAEQAQYSIKYDAASRITEIATGAASTPIKASYGYDNLDRLIQATLPSATYSYDLDLNGNRTKRVISGAGSSTTTYTYAATSNRLQSVQQDSKPAQAITTDATGNITVDAANPVGTINYAYATGEGLVVTGRLSTSYGPLARHVYSHNGLGQRIRKAGSTLSSGGVTYSPPAYVGSSDTYFHYDQAGQLIAESDVSQLVKREYIWLYDMPVAVITGATPTQPVRSTGTPNPPAIHNIHPDHLNTPRLITDTAGAERWEWSAIGEPFGITAANGAPQGQAAAQRLDFHLRFPGQYFDVETTTAYNYFRTYNPHTGRYVQSDPIGLVGGINTYAYVDGNPVLYIDPTGEIAFVPIAIGIGVGYAFDYILEQYKKERCACKETPLGPVGNSAVGGTLGLFGPFASKPRTGIAGGGPSGSTTSVFSQLNHAAASRGWYSVPTRNLITRFARKVPYLGGALGAYELYDALSCD
ncbi:RHS repeat-associated core domain-containing protein [Aquabacterium sp. A7-Y]|uniref:RHS repeat-associated core domain-containing protein n=1 Tax=Aquabacterium sp. A7-Y TaxID=1349605 RepID=UPI00223E445D|nr:RHS repeat-associated core domain-containing protein [Aquabacterium sp. A7-Y]MCW7536263.1 RHS repeat-associated core domain-containing protein [Aquabacterium sp. A7-Y]